MHTCIGVRVHARMQVLAFDVAELGLHRWPVARAQRVHVMRQIVDRRPPCTLYRLRRQELVEEVMQPALVDAAPASGASRQARKEARRVRVRVRVMQPALVDAAPASGVSRQARKVRR